MKMLKKKKKLGKKIPKISKDVMWQNSKKTITKKNEYVVRTITNFTQRIDYLVQPWQTKKKKKNN